MNKIWMLILFVGISICLTAQQKTEYNIKGDEAMARLDYSDARLYYEEGVFDCDMYSINQLTNIWLQNDQMRSSMRGLMSKCLKCLNEKATSNDSIAISKLITYYTDGIGTPPSEELASYWTKYLEELNKPVYTPETKLIYTTEISQPMTFFAGYTFSVLTPVGVTIGGVGKQYGWYARFKSNMSFQSAPYIYSKSSGKPENISDILDPLEIRRNAHIGTAGLIIKYNTNLSFSAGLGYGSIDFLYSYNKLNDDGSIKGKIWCINQEDSFKGVSLETDMMYKFNTFYVSLGCNTLTFKSLDLNAGIGVFF